MAGETEGAGRSKIGGNLNEDRLYKEKKSIFSKRENMNYSSF